ncbi:MAG: hypothetical protein ACYCYR_12275 [Desulfobulbaceae bacterium]
MKPYLASLPVLLLAFLVGTAGFARAQFELCRYQCEQDQQVKMAPCCKDASGAHYSSTKHDAEPERACPHLAGGMNFSYFSLHAPGAKVPAPLAFPTAAPLRAFYPTAVAKRASLPSSGTSPPRLNPAPLYHLHCSLLI